MGVFRLGWRWGLALLFFLFAMIGFSSGVSVTERPDIVDGPFVRMAYYSLGLFVVGGLDIGTPTGGPLPARILLWIAFFGSPLLAASAVVEAVLSTFYRQRWHISRVKDHILVVGAGDITSSYLRVLRAEDKTTPVIVVDTQIDTVRELELAETYGAIVVIGDMTHEFMINELRLHRAKRVMLLGDNDFLSFEAASKIVRMYPKLAGRTVIHGTSLRFLRAIQGTQIAKATECFNSYNLAAACLVRDELLDHFEKTQEKDTVILAGFGLFGQTILEELHEKAGGQLSTVAVMDLNADRRMHIVEEQRRITADDYDNLYEGDISHPAIWRRLTREVDLSVGEPVLIFGTGDSAANLRTALWVKQKYPNALIFTRTNDSSEFAMQIAADHGLNCISITNLVEQNMPAVWLD